MEPMSTLAATVRVGDTLYTAREWWVVVGTQFSTPREGQVTFTIRPADDPRGEQRKVSCGAALKVTVARA